MPGFFTDYLNNRLLDLVLGRKPFRPPVILWVGLSLSTANKSGAVVEPRTACYARVPVPNDRISFPPAVAGTKANAEAIEFPPPATGWGLVQSLFLADAAIGGNVLSMASLAAPRVIGPNLFGEPRGPRVEPGGLFFSHT